LSASPSTMINTKMDIVVHDRFNPTNAQKERAKALAKEVEAFDWSEHCTVDETPDQARISHHQELRRKHGAGWTRVDDKGEGVTGTKHPSAKQIYMESLWQDLRNLASIPVHILPTAFKPKARIISDQSTIANWRDQSVLFARTRAIASRALGASARLFGMSFQLNPFQFTAFFELTSSLSLSFAAAGIATEWRLSIFGFASIRTASTQRSILQLLYISSRKLCARAKMRSSWHDGRPGRGNALQPQDQQLFQDLQPYASLSGDRPWENSLPQFGRS